MADVERELTVGAELKIALVGDSVRVGEGPDADYYEGPYVVVPDFSGKVLETEGDLMSSDVEMRPIPVSKVSNDAGGYTYTIG